MSLITQIVNLTTQAGKGVKDIEVDLRLTVLKPLHAQWLVDMYNHFSTAIGKEMILKGWKRAEVQGVIDGSVTLPPAKFIPDHFSVTITTHKM